MNPCDIGESFLTETETKYKAETKAEAENSEALDYSEILGVITRSELIVLAVLFVN